MRLIDADELQQLFNAVSTDLLTLPELTKDAEHMVRAFLMVTEMIRDAPTIEAEPERHGRWEEVMTNVYIGCLGFEEATCNEFECSECGYRVNTEDRFVYCPNCGAKMDGVVKE